MSRNLVVAGNFNLTNVDEQFQQLIELGQHPKEKADTVTVLEKIGHFLDVQNEKLFKKFKAEGHSNREISELIAVHLDVADILKQASKRFDGGYVIGGMIGHGDAFIMRDPNGIRPCYYIHTDEVFAAASERPALQTAFNLMIEDVKELKPGYAIIIKKDGTITEEMIREPQQKLSCSFERIYFSRGSDANIYRERKELGRRLTQKVLKAIDYDIDNTVFSFIPNTAEVAFLGLIKGVESYINEQKAVLIKDAGPNIGDNELKNILDRAARVEKIAIKDAKLRTFITDDLHRDEMVAHVYDVTYGTVRRGIDTLVIVDDSIVRGTTLKQSILKMLDRLGPKKIVVVSSAPQIRYPDCYGIDMAKLGDFIAFQAAVSLHKKRKTNTIEEVLASCAEQENYVGDQVENQVKKIYDAFTEEETSDEIALIMKPEGIQAEVKVVFQSLDDLHLACPNHLGDWYFSGNYPTPGGKKVVNKAFLNYARKVNERAY
jgi:amidophosphoribosyltransferase